MKVLHIGGLNYSNGGPSLSTYLTMKGLEENGVDVHCLSRDVPQGDKLVCDSRYVSFMRKPAVRIGGYELIPGITASINELVPFDIMHIQGIWSSHMHKAAQYAISNRIPYLIAPRGSLYPQAMEISRLKKVVSMFLYQKEELQKAACIQATCEQELIYYRDLGFKNPVAILPNPIEVVEDAEGIEADSPLVRFGYLGRLHPRKRVERLIYAFAESSDLKTKGELHIIGTDDVEYEKFLKQEVERLDLKNVVFRGFLKGAEKDKAIRTLSYLINPSDFENFGNVVTEALSRRVPVIATKGAPWQIVEQYHCGWWINNDQESVTKTMIEALNVSEEERKQMGYNGRQLVEKEFSVNVLGRKMKALYGWILSGGKVPSFVDVVH